MTRAACTYSLLRSTSVEPRTVRAYCTQPGSAMARISTPNASDVVARSGSSARPTPAISSAIRIAGNDSSTSHTRMMKRVDPAADVAARQAERHADHARDSSTDASADAAARCARRTSAPTGRRGPGRRCRAGTWPCRLSIHAGGSIASRSSSVARSNGLCGATHVREHRAERRRRSATAAEPIATGERAERVPDVAVEEARPARRRRRGTRPRRRSHRTPAVAAR